MEPGVAIGPSRKPEQQMFLKTYVKRVVLVAASATAALLLAGCENQDRNTRPILFTADEQGRSISVINPETGQVETTRIAVSPHNVQVSSDGRSLFAVGASAPQGPDGEAEMDGPGRLLIFDASAVSKGPSTTIPVGRMPAHVVVDARSERAFVTSAGDNMLTVVDLKSGSVDRNITVGRSPHGLRMSPDGRTLYVANTGDGTVSVVDAVDLDEVERIPVGRGPVQVAFTPDGRFPERLWQGEHDFLNLHRRVLGGLQGHCSQRSGAVEYLPPPPMLTIPAETDVKGDLQQECPGVTDVQIRLDRCHS